VIALALKCLWMEFKGYGQLQRPFGNESCPAFGNSVDIPYGAKADGQHRLEIRPFAVLSTLTASALRMRL